jgi:hypothetical protein
MKESTMANVRIDKRVMSLDDIVDVLQHVTSMTESNEYISISVSEEGLVLLLPKIPETATLTSTGNMYMISAQAAGSPVAVHDVYEADYDDSENDVEYEVLDADEPFEGECEFEAIKGINLVEDARLVGADLIVDTEDISIEGTYIGRFSFKINLRDGVQEFRNTVKKVRDDYGEAQHPHIRNGSACYGNANSSITSAINNREYYMAVMLIMSFLQTVDRVDSWGCIIEEWDNE